MAEEGDLEFQQESDFAKLKMVERPQMTFFYQHRYEDPETGEESFGAPFACAETEAALLEINTAEKIKFIGSSDGTAYSNTIKNAKTKATCKKCQGKKYLQETVIKNDKHETVNIPCEACKAMGFVEIAITPKIVITKELATQILEDAFQAELAQARENRKNKQARRPVLQNIHFDDTITRHRNARHIMDSFSPPA